MDTSPESNVESRELSPSHHDPPQAERRLSAISSLLGNLDEAACASGAPQAKSHRVYQNQLVQVRLGIAGALFAALRAKHAPSAAHCLRAALSCSSWALAMDLEQASRDELEVAALLHDVGKIGVSDHVLLKPGKLDADEAARMDRHHRMGLEILAGCCASRNILEMVEYASAWFDGSKAGFDRHGEDLPLGARMIAIADAFDAMTTDHIYRRAMSQERAVAELFRNAGTQFDGELVKSFCKLQTDRPHGLGEAVAHRWLRELDGRSSNAFWQLGRPTDSADPLAVSSLFHEKLFENMHDGVVFVDRDLRILLWNRAAERLTGIPADSIRHKRWSSSLIHMCDEQGRVAADSDCLLELTIRSGAQLLRRVTITGRAGQEISVNAHTVPITAGDSTVCGAALLLHDASSVITLEERVQTLHEKAIRDPLTQIANRAEFDRVHAKFVQTHLKRLLPCALIMCDLDHFKQINDTYGHQAGDEVLINFATLLSRSCREGDLVARYGGEEFVMLCVDCDNAAATRRAEQVRAEFAGMPQPMLGGKSVTASFGVTEIQLGDTPETLLRRSDRALLKAKDLGRNSVVQLGTGIRDAEPQRRAGGWFSWFRRDPPETLLHRQLATSVPIQVAAEKLRGFVADHHAEFVSIDEDQVVLNIEGDAVPMLRRHADRPAPFVIELRFAETHIPIRNHTGAEPEGTARTTIDVTIRPKRNRDRRRGDAVERARQLLISLKSYMMAYDYLDAGPNEADQIRQDGVLAKAKNLFAPWLGSEPSRGTEA